MKKALVGIVAGLLVVTGVLAKPGTSKNLGKKEWPAVNGVTTLGNKLYVASGLTLLVADAAGKSTDLYPHGSPEWGNPEMLTTLDGKIYMLCNGTLYRIDPKDGKETKLSEGYRYPGGIAGLAGSLYVASDYALWKVDPKTGVYKKFTDRDWYNVHDVVALDGNLYVVDGYSLHEVKSDGKYKQLPGTWSGVGGMTAANGKLYLFINEPPTPGIHQVDKTGKDTVLPLPADWDGTTGISGLTVMNGKLYLLMPTMVSYIQLFSVDTK